MKYDNYYKNRGVEFVNRGYIPYCLDEMIKKTNKNARILDIGCGQGVFLMGLRDMGFKNIYGIDLDQQAVDFCVKNGLNVKRMNCMDLNTLEEKFDFISMNHVLEHLKKDDVIPMIKHIFDNLLKKTGLLFISVPNAQSNTGCYWAYEDFTHYTLYTSGSLNFVLQSGGATEIKFLDPDSLGKKYRFSEGKKAALRWRFRFIMLKYYKWKVKFWNKITGSAYHASSPQIFGYELKVLAKK